MKLRINQAKEDTPSILLRRYPAILLILTIILILPGVTVQGKEKPFKPDGIILHVTGCPGPKGLLAAGNKVPPEKNYHYLVTCEGEVKKGYADTVRLIHMGDKLTLRSLAVMIETPGGIPKNHTLAGAVVKLPQKQRASLEKLLFSLMEKHNIPLSQIERHIDHDLDVECPGNHFPFFDILHTMAKSMIKARGNPLLEEIAAAKKIPLPLPDARILVTKSDKTLKLYNGNTHLKTYRIALSNRPTGDKLKEGDRRTPTGDFIICEKYPLRGWMEINYPGKKHAEIGLKQKIITKVHYDTIISAAEKRGLPKHHTPMGQDVGFHAGGFPYGKMRTDYTAGCVGLEDPEAFELYYAVPIGAKVTIKE